jgi:hypothetical protein
MARLVSIAALVMLACSGCGDDVAGGGSGTGAATSTGGAGAGGSGNAGGQGGDAPCAEDPSTIPEGAICLLQVDGRVVDEAGAGIDGLLVSVCGPQACNPGETQGDGSFTVDVGFHLVTGDYSAIAHVRSLNKTSFYFRLPIDAPGPEITVGELLTLDLPTDGPSLVVATDDAGAPAQSVTSNGVTLEVDDGVQIALDVEDVIEGEEGKKFRALSVPPALHASFVDPSLGVAALYAFRPFDVTFHEEGDVFALQKARLILPNDAALPAGSAVQILALGSYLFADWVFPGAFEPVATATVSPDGTQIVLDAGEGLEHLTWVAVVPVQ